VPYRLSRLTAILVLGGALVAITAALLTPAVGAVLGAHQTAPVTEIDLDALSQRSRVLDVHGNLMTYLYREENRQVVRLD
jgi:hypothetical protein